jgi:hypothetical protein
MASRAPIDPSTPLSGIRRPGEAAPRADATWLAVTDGYFEAVGIPLVAGRDFTRAEIDRRADVAIVNESLVSRLWPHGGAVGAALTLDAPGRTLTIVGVARDAKYRSLADAGALHVYVPVAPSFGLALLSRATGDPRQALVAIQWELDRVGPGVVGFFPRTLDDHLALELLPGRAAASAAAGLGLVAWGLSVTGLYGLVAWFVEVRRREIGIRMALGASRSDVRRLIVKQALTAAAPGVVAGVVIAAVMAAGARAVLAGIAPLDPLPHVGGLGAIALVVLLASALPTRRATRIDPAASLRE